VRLLVAAAIALVLVPAAIASERHPTLGELEGEVICPTCHVTIDQSDSPIARRMKAFIATRIRAGDTKSAIEAKLVAQFGPEVIAKPSKHGFDLLAWLLPLAGVIGGAGVLAIVAQRWARKPRDSPLVDEPETLDPELERRVDDELARFEP
jgi:cytochrome c-type biogenesis protein CcmH